MSDDYSSPYKELGISVSPIPKKRKTLKEEWPGDADRNRLHKKVRSKKEHRRRFALRLTKVGGVW